MKKKGTSRLKRVLPALAAVVFLLLAALSCGPSAEEVLRTADGEMITFAEMMEGLFKVSLVFIGEHHNNPNHHAAQLRVIRALHESGRKVAIGLEMFHDGHQEEIDSWLKGEMDIHDFIETYYHNWSEPWELYKDIFLFARDNELPLVALNSSPEITRQVAAHGFDSLTDEQVANLTGVSCNVDPDYEEFIRRALGEHEGSRQNFRHFCEAQMVWDTTMAYKTVRFMEENPRHTMVVLAGSGHSWKHGIPEQVRRQADLASRSILPEAEEGLDRSSVTANDTDYLWLGI